MVEEIYVRRAQNKNNRGKRKRRLGKTGGEKQPGVTIM